MEKQIWKAVVPVLVAVVIALLPVPEGLTPNAWNYFALFAGVVVGLILEPIFAAAVAVSDLVLSPFNPSNTARSGRTIYPIIKNIPPLFGSTPEENPRKIGSYLMWTAIATTCVTSSLFLTGLAPNLLALTLVQKTANVSISWTEWDPLSLTSCR